MNAREAQMPGMSGIEAYEKRMQMEAMSEARHEAMLRRMSTLCADVQQTINMIEANVASQKVDIVRGHCGNGNGGGR